MIMTRTITIIIIIIIIIVIIIIIIIIMMLLSKCAVYCRKNQNLLKSMKLVDY